MDYDIIVIGGGPGGYVAGIRAAQMGARVAVIEKDRLGGACLNRGCIPTKALLAGVALKRELERASEFGLSAGELKLDYAVLAARKDTVVKRLVQGIQFLLKKNKVELISGMGSLAGPGRVAVELPGGKREELAAKAIILATGSEPALMESLGYNGQTVVTSNEALAWQSIPESLLVIGGGVIGCEFAVLYSLLGARVTILEVLPDILAPVDLEIARTMRSLLQKQGIEIKTGAVISTLGEEKGVATAQLENGEELHAERALISIGRRLNTEGLGLQGAGVALGKRGEVVIDDYLQTSQPGVYAIGDLTGKIQLAHVASAQGIAAVKNILDAPVVMDYETVPNCIFTLPEIAGVGLTSQEAEARGIKVKTGKFPFLASGKAQAGGQTEGMVKILAEAESGQIVGAHILGPHATDLIAEAVLAIRYRLTARQLAETIHAHPTLPEAMAEAAAAVDGLSIHY
jgi:dihydrolipoamide dehydrogenase